MSRSMVRTVVAVIAMAMATASAFADSVDVRFVGKGLGRNVKINVGGSKLNVFSGQLIHNFSNGTGAASSLHGDLLTFCTEVTQFVTGDAKTYDLTGVENAPSNPGPMGPQAASAIYDLFAFAAGAQFATNDTSANRNFASAFQIAVWEVVNDFDGTLDSLDVTDGSLIVTKTSGGKLPGSIMDILDDLFGAIGGGAGPNGLRAVRHSQFQDQLVMIPLPAPVLLGLAGLGGVVVLRRRKTRASRPE